MFDNDETVGKKYDKESYSELGGNVYAWCIPNPRQLSYGISVEFLYEENDIKLQDKDNKRLYLSDEFKEKNLRLKSNLLISTRARNSVNDFYTKGIVKIIDGEDVFDEEENVVSLSKKQFAEYILNKEPPFDNVNIKHFEELFNRIRKIING